MDEELLGEDGGEVPSGEVLQGDESQKVVVSFRVVPGAGTILPQDEACNTSPQLSSLPTPPQPPPPPPLIIRKHTHTQK